LLYSILSKFINGNDGIIAPNVFRFRLVKNGNSSTDLSLEDDKQSKISSNFASEDKLNSLRAAKIVKNLD
jgi:hypothetical protein